MWLSLPHKCMPGLALAPPRRGSRIWKWREGWRWQQPRTAACMFGTQARCSRQSPPLRMHAARMVAFLSRLPFALTTRVPCNTMLTLFGANTERSQHWRCFLIDVGKCQHKVCFVLYFYYAQGVSKPAEHVVMYHCWEKAIPGLLALAKQRHQLTVDSREAFLD